MTADGVHRWLLSWQPAWFKAMPQPLRELPAGLLVLPPLWLTHDPWASLIGFAIGSHLYEAIFPGFSPADALYRLYPALALTYLSHLLA